MADDRTIHIRDCVFGSRFVVSFEPRSVAWPSIEFRTYAEARDCANARHSGHGWPIVDHADRGAG